MYITINIFKYKHDKYIMTTATTTIPKIIHQLWIGPKPRPSKFMDTWKDKHPDFEYIWWSESEIKNRGLKLECTKQIDDMSEINGKADIIRWEILYHYGGFFMDADSICIKPFDNLIMYQKAFAGYENEQVRKGLVATGTMGFPPKHPLCRAAIDWILRNDVSVERTGNRAWKSVGPGLLTRLLQTGLYKDVTIFPSYFFLPVHHTGITYNGHNKVYAYQEWGSTKLNYDIMNSIELPPIFQEPEPDNWVSVLVSSYNTNPLHMKECLESIKHQQGHFGIELVWVNDGSTEENTAFLKKILKDFKLTTRFCKVFYKTMGKNVGIGASLNAGILICNNELVIKMDSDDIMVSNRIATQLQFMKSNPECVMCGSNIQFFQVPNEIEKPNEKVGGQQTNHPTQLTWTDYKKSKPHWFMNHPSICYKKSAVLAVGNYNKSTKNVAEDFELEVKILKKFGQVYNIPEVLLYYRIHPGQVTFQGKSSTPEWKERRSKFIENMINSDDNETDISM